MGQQSAVLINAACGLQIIIIVFFLCDNVCAKLPQPDIHRFMDDHELKYYFGSTDEIPAYEIVNVLKEVNPFQKSSFKISLKIVDQPHLFEMKLNDRLVSPEIKFIIKSSNGTRTVFNSIIDNCHYIYSDSETSAAFSNCYETDMVCLFFF